MESRKVNMSVNFNNLRKQAILQLEDITRDMNNAIIKDTQYAKPNDVYHEQSINIKGYVLIDSTILENKMNSLISLVNSIGCVYEEGNEEFSDISSELSDTPLWFND